MCHSTCESARETLNRFVSWLNAKCFKARLVSPFSIRKWLSSVSKRVWNPSGSNQSIRAYVIQGRAAWRTWESSLCITRKMRTTRLKIKYSPRVPKCQWRTCNLNTRLNQRCPRTPETCLQPTRSLVPLLKCLWRWDNSFLAQQSTRHQAETLAKRMWNVGIAFSGKVPKTASTSLPKMRSVTTSLSMQTSLVQTCHVKTEFYPQNLGW